MGASIKIMLSYDYCHFEVCKSTDDNITDVAINEMRKDVRRLCDEAVRQFIRAKERALFRSVNFSDMTRAEFEAACTKAKAKPETARSPAEMGWLKQIEDENWQRHFEDDYYDDAGQGD